MEIIHRTIYKAYDNTEFENEKECLFYERCNREVDEIMSNLNPVPHNIDFYNGCGYIQQKQRDVINAKSLLNDFIKNNYNYEELPRFISAALNRFNCTDYHFKEYGQMYFATHQCKVKGGCLNGND